MYGREEEIQFVTLGREARESVEPAAGALNFDAQLVLAVIVVMPIGERARTNDLVVAALNRRPHSSLSYRLSRCSSTESSLGEWAICGHGPAGPAAGRTLAEWTLQVHDVYVLRHQEACSRARQLRTLDAHSQQRDRQSSEQMLGEEGVDELDLQHSLSKWGAAPTGRGVGGAAQTRKIKRRAPQPQTSNAGTERLSDNRPGWRRGCSGPLRRTEVDHRPRPVSRVGSQGRAQRPGLRGVPCAFAQRGCLDPQQRCQRGLPPVPLRPERLIFV